MVWVKLEFSVSYKSSEFLYYYFSRTKSIHTINFGSVMAVWEARIQLLCVLGHQFWGVFLVFFASIPLECICFVHVWLKPQKQTTFVFMDCCTRIWFWWKEEEVLLAGGLAYLCELLTALVNYCQLCSHCTRYSVLSIAGVITSVVHAYPVNSCRFCVRNLATTACYCKFLFWSKRWPLTVQPCVLYTAKVLVLSSELTVHIELKLC